MKAIKENNFQIVDSLLNDGFNPNTTDDDEFTALHHASQIGNLEIVEVLIEKGADIHAKSKSGDSIFIWACWGGKIDIIKVLIEKGADINSEDKYGHTGLKIAELQNNTELKELLLKNRVGNKMNKMDPISTLFNAASYGQLSLFESIVMDGMDLDVTDHRGLTALMIAAKNGHTNLVQALINHNVEIEKTILNKVRH